MNDNDNIFYLIHILEAINDIEESTKNISKEKFEKSKDKKDAIIRRIEVIGEAVKNISVSTRDKYSEIEWKKIAGTRDRIIHSYFDVDLDIVWDIIKKELPILKKKILDIKKDLENG